MKLTKVLTTISIILFSFIAVIITLGFVYFLVTIFVLEDLDYQLSDQLGQVALSLKVYKNQTGSYPSDLNTINQTSEICFYYILCQELAYKSTADKQSFRLAIRTFTGGILYYHPDYSATLSEYQQMSPEARTAMTDGKSVCFFCFSRDESDTPFRGTHDIVYRKTLPIFANPHEWPEL